MKKLLLSALAVGALFAQTQPADLEDKIKNLEKQVQELKKIAISNQKKINPIAANDHLFWSYDLRSAVDFIQYKHTDGSKDANNVFTNRVLLTGVAKPSDNLKATLRIEAYNIYGMDGNPYAMYQNNNALANETPDDTGVRVRDAYFNYYFGPNDGLMFSAGRRPAVEGYPANFRNGDANANSPLAHLINMEFDGMSFEIGNAVWSEWSEKFAEWGTWIKFCGGRGYTPNYGYFSQTPYAKGDDKINDFAGMIFVPYDDGQYSLKAEVVKAWNVRGLAIPPTPDMTPDQLLMGMKALGGYFGYNILLNANGIGDEISDFFDNTTAFISFAQSKTLPSSGEQMLGSTDSKIGLSIWVGADMPGANESDRWGFNYVHGTKYWRSMTYGEDTIIGSIAAARGDAYELYYHYQIIPHLTAGIRATLIKYSYTGSNAFFGYDGMPLDVDDVPSAVKDAKDLRVYIRYNF